MSIISAVILLGILVFVHEFGHFLFAKLLNVKVEKFSLGFGPKVISRKYGETEYLVSALPLGGYVKMLGQSDLPSEEKEPMSEEDKLRAFNHQSVLKRFAIVVSGPVFNLVFAAAVLALIFLSGVPQFLPEVGGVLANTPAMAAGLKEGDKVVEVDGRGIALWSELTEVIHGSPGKPLRVKVHRGEESFEVSVTPERKIVQNVFGEDREVGLIGIKPSGSQITKKYGLFEAVPMAVARTWDIIALTLEAFLKLIMRVIPADTLGGPIMIFAMAGEQAQEGARNFFGFMAFISINLGVINLFPIPVLDGGHVMFLALEAVRKKPLSEKVQLVAQKVGFAIIIALIAFVIYNDLFKLFTGQDFP